MAASPLPPPTDEANPADLLQTLFDVSLTGLILFRPLYDQPGGQIIDLAYERLNPAAQQMLGRPERPAETFLTLYPAAAATGVFAFYRDAFLGGQPAQLDINYQHDGLDGYFRLAAQRQGARLVVSFTDTNDQPRSPLEQNLRHDQAQTRQQTAYLNQELEAARAEAERQRQELTRVFEQAPIAIAVYQGPAYTIRLANPTVARLWGRTREQLIGKGLFEALPEVAGLGYEQLLDGVMATGQPYVAHAMEAQHERNGRRDTVYWDFVYVPTYAADGRIDGVMVVATEVTEQVLARRQLEEKERQTNFLNEELQAANEEILANNAELEHAQAALRQLNDELERRVAERTGQLQQQQSLLSQILGQVPAYIATLGGPEHRFTFFNAPYQQLVAGARLGRRMGEALPELLEQGFGELLDQVYSSGQPYAGRELAILLAQPQGPPRQYYFDFTYQPLFDGQGRVQGILIFAVDVTAQVRSRRQADTMQAALLGVAQRQAQQRQELFQIFEQTPVAIVLLREPEHRIDYFNPAFEALFPPDDWAGGSLRGHRIGEVYPRIREAGLVALLDGVFITGESQTVRDMPLAELQPGSPRYVTFAYQAYREAGRIVGVAAFVYDTTEQVRGRQERERQQQELRQIFEQAPVAITVLRGPELRVELANEAISAIWGRPASQTVGRPYFEAVPDTAGQGFEDILAGVLQSGEPFFINEAPVQLDRAHTGRPALGYFNFVFQPLLGEQRQAVGLVAIGTEVTDQVLARQQVQGLNDDLYASNAHLTRTNTDLDTFVYTASHDLKSPITNIEGLLLALREELPPAADQPALVPRLLEMMDGAVRRFQQTLGHLTDVSRLQRQAPAEQHAPETVDLPALTEAVRLDILPELTAAGATLTVDVAACPALHCSARSLRSILYNLLSNAVKYRDPTRPAQVALRCRPAAAGQVRLEVQDNGLGLSAAQQQELFRLFRRLHSHVAGSGVGLYMVKKMVDNAGGTLSVSSEPGVGSTFTVTLPG